jgi:glycosyltransferase involved in cell wall biosynthesis
MTQPVMKIAMLTTVGPGCGIATYTSSLIASLSRVEEVRVEPIRVGRQPDAFYRDQAARLNEADVIHIQHEHSFFGDVLPGKSAYWTLRNLLTRPVVVTAHTTTSLREILRVDAERRLPHRLVKLALLARRGYRDSVESAPFTTDRTIVHTAAAKEELIGRGGSRGHLHVIPAGVPDVMSSKDQGRRFRERHNLADRRIVALFGFIAPNKGYEPAIEAWKELGDDVVLVIAGGARTADMAPYAATVGKLVQRSGLADRVITTGFLDEVELAEVMAAADLVIAPHTYATGSYSVMVALAYGKAIVASDMDCFLEIAADGSALRTCKAGDSRSLAEAISALLANAAERETLASNARAYAMRRSWDSVAARTIQVYGEAMSDGARSAQHARRARG